MSGDEYHSMDELYEYRMLYNAHAANEWARHSTYPVVKSWKHSDGELCFGGGWFVVVVTLPEGQASNHYMAEYWDLFNVPEVDLPPMYDGHTPRDAADRLMRAIVREVKEGVPQSKPEPPMCVACQKRPATVLETKPDKSDAMLCLPCYYDL